jgi:hypothetical protein
VLIGEFPEYLDNLGANTLTIEVWDENKVVQYKGPNDPSGDSDFTIVEGTETTPSAIQRTSTSEIASGATVLIDYSHEENFTVKYKTNLVVQVAQEELNTKRHGAADVVAKEALLVPVDITATILLPRGTTKSTVDSAIRTNLTNYLARADEFTQSNAIKVIEKTAGVSSLIVPLTILSRQAGSKVVREPLSTGQTGDVTYISDWSTGTVSVWLIENALSCVVADNGGPDTEFKGAFQDEIALTLRASNPELLGNSEGEVYIIGDSGLSIPGVSDDTTLGAAGYVTAQEKAAALKSLTANRIVVSTNVDDSPANHDYTLSYVVGTPTDVRDLTLQDIEQFTAGNFDFTYDERR